MWVTDLGAGCWADAVTLERRIKTLNPSKGLARSGGLLLIPKLPSGNDGAIAERKGTGNT